MARPKKKVQPKTQLTLADKKRLIKQAFIREIRLTNVIYLDEWSDKYRVLVSESSSERGKWDTNRFPFLRRIMRCLSPMSIAEEIVFMKGCQIGGTEMGINWLLYCSDVDPGPHVYLQKKEDDVKEFSRQRLKPVLKACDHLRSILGEDKPKGYANSWDEKGYPGGYISLGAANNAEYLRSKPVGRVFADEEDTYEKDIGEQGSPLELVRKRMVNFPGHKLYRVSTPILKETSTIYPAWQFGSQERYYLPCPHCNASADLDAGNIFYLTWEQIKWDDKRDKHTALPSKVWLECPHCGTAIDEVEHKTWMLEHGDWFSEKGNEEGERPYRVGETKYVSFHMSALYSPLGFFSWSDAVAEWFKYLQKRDPALLKVFVNQTLGEVYSADHHEVAHQRLESRREMYTAEVPREALKLTCGVDVQKDRLELEVVGWGMFEENWSIDFVRLMGNPAVPYDREGITADGEYSVWRVLDEYLMRKFAHESGIQMPIEMTMIDSSYLPDAVHNYCRFREHMRVFPVRGKPGDGIGLWEVASKRNQQRGTYLYYAYVDELKRKVYSQLKLEQPGPGYCHFPQKDLYNRYYFRGLTCETLEPFVQRGYTKFRWEKPNGARNEPIDCRNYALVAHLALPVDLSARWRALGNDITTRTAS